MAVMGGRVIPMFTNNGIPGAQATRILGREVRVRQRAALLVADLLPVPAWRVTRLARRGRGACGAALALAAMANGAGADGLGAARGLCLDRRLPRAARVGGDGLGAELFAVHALTIGAIGGMTIGMMTRTARGHTGRPLTADRFEVACYVLVALAAVIRVFGGMWLPDAYLATVVVSGICWSAAFALYAVRYWPVLTRNRLDGKPG